MSHDQSGIERLRPVDPHPARGLLFSLVMMLLLPSCLPVFSDAGIFDGTKDSGTVFDDSGDGDGDGNGNGNGNGNGSCPGTPYTAPPPVTPTCAGDVVMGAPTKITGPGNTSSAGGVTVATGDLDGDGNVDFATTLSNKLFVYFGTGAGDFSQPIQLESQTFSTWLSGPVALGDFDADGLLDVAAVGVFSANDGHPAVWLNQGDRSFGVANRDDSYNAYDAGGDVITNGAGGNMVAADLNRDGMSDLVYCGYRSRIYISSCDAMPGGTDLVLTDEYEYTVRNCEVTNLPDGDSNPDLVVQQFDFLGVGRLSILHGNGAGGFSEQVDATNFSEYAVLADLTNDGLKDLGLLYSAGGESEQGSVEVMLGESDGTFSLLPGTFDVTSGYPGGSGADFPNIIAADVTNDGNIDLGIINAYEEGSWSLLAGNGDGTFQPETRLTHTVGYESAAAFADLNNDGLMDMIATDSMDVSITLNRCL